MYEYKIIHSSIEIGENKLNLLSKQGWELVSVVFIENTLTYYMKTLKK